STTSPLPGGWQVAAFVPGERLTLARAGKVELREVLRRLFVVLGATALIVVLAAGAERVGRSFFWVMAPVIVLLLAVVVFGRLARGARGGAVSGLGIAPRAGRKALALQVRRGAGPNPRDPRCWALLELTLDDGTRLEAPEAWGPDDAYDATEALLLPLGRELS